jgi:hypothetical protein
MLFAVGGGVFGFLIGYGALAGFNVGDEKPSGGLAIRTYVVSRREKK